MPIYQITLHDALGGLDHTALTERTVPNSQLLRSLWHKWSRVYLRGVLRVRHRSTQRYPGSDARVIIQNHIHVVQGLCSGSLLAHVGWLHSRRAVWICPFVPRTMSWTCI
ncbi:uncharacterized protein PV06_06889 [Exophiala oligosperma]|uniref:Uncharacterized protein n=1 Tax=Exophiala oligosperma TaxID=215243 RepID=A0A0D2DFX3_9EURO|nr:uncharacterized protein PV06_06889 [Exophiala oligosperma]KIW41320.1 hypothetical protein PV06_06889 [Exophiala oligosperma]